MAPTQKAKRETQSGKRMAHSVKGMRKTQGAKRLALCAVRCAHQSALEGGDCASKVIQTFQEVISTRPGYELSAVKDNEHVGVFEGRATSNVQELAEFAFRRAPRSFRNVIRSRNSRTPELLRESVELFGFQLIGNVKQEIRDLNRHPPDLQILKSKLYTRHPFASCARWLWRSGLRAKRHALCSLRFALCPLLFVD
jgi:hypothetical protein